MQFHLNGFRPGDPRIADPAVDQQPPPSSGHLPDEVDVLIVGAGPAGLQLAAQLAAFPDITTRIVEQEPGPLLVGRADGIAVRTVEVFEAFGFSERVLKEAYWVNETTFWKPDEHRRERIVRSSRIEDTEEGLSEFPHVILNQARVHDFLLDVMRNSPSRLEPDYSWRVTDLAVEAAPPAGGGDVTGPEAADVHPATVTLERVGPPHAGQVAQVRARYVVGCDGAHSTVRKRLGLALHGDSANKAWGVMDVLAVTDFPDVRLKSVIHSGNQGNMLVIPREGGYLVRFYIELDELAEDERVANRNITSDRLVAAAQRILHPYTLGVKEIAWWSVYEIGQRLCERFDDVPHDEVDDRRPRVFIAGDACHTHSPKAGQGMNVSLRDGFNLGWKLAAVLRGEASPRLLHTYSAERHAVAEELIDFDREFAAMFSAPPRASDEAGGEGVDPSEFQRYFVQHGRFTAGTATRYEPSIITSEPTYQHLAKGLHIGMRFHSAPVIRVADAKPVHLGHAVKADGRWRVFAFAAAEDPTAPASAIRRLCAFLTEDAASPLRRYTRTGADIDSIIDVRAVFPQPHHEIAFAHVPALLLPRKGRYGLRDYEKVFSADVDSGADIFDMRGIDPHRGCVVIVRPDQHVANVLPLDAHAQLADFFDGFMLDAR